MVSDQTFASMKQGKGAQQIADRVRDAVLGGELQVGERLPPERELIRLTGYSRAVVREGLRILEAEGLVALHAGRNGGAVIERPNADRFAATLDVLLGLDSIGAKEVSEVLSMFETRIVELAVDRISAHDIEDLRRTITRIEEDPTDVERVRIESNRFHILLAEATRNRMLALLTRVIRQVVIRMDHEFARHERAADRPRAPAYPRRYRRRRRRNGEAARASPSHGLRRLDVAGG